MKKLNDVFTVAILNITVAHFLNGNGIRASSPSRVRGAEDRTATMNGNGGVGRVCPSDYVHHKTFNGTTAIESSLRRCKQLRSEHEENCQELSQQHVLETAKQVPPIEIVRQDGSFVEFKVYNSPFFASAASSAGFINDVGSQDQDEGLQQIFTVFEEGVYRQRYCHVSNDDSMSVDVTFSSNEILKSHCSTMGKFAQVSVYVRFDDNAGDGDNQSSFRVPACCPDIHSSSQIIEFVFNLACLPTCDDPIEYIEYMDDVSSSESSRESLQMEKRT